MTTEPLDTCDVAIVGGGPAGLAAAAELRRLGAGDILVLEREPVAGGIPRHCGHYPFGMREFGRVMRGPDLARRLVARATEAGVRIRTGVSVMELRNGPELLVSTAEGLGRISARRVVLATGVRETSRAARMIGGTKPGGVLSTGALQGMVYLENTRPFLRPVILGTELVSFSALLTCRHAGIRPVAMIEPNPRPTAWRLAPLLPRAMGVAMHFNAAVTDISGRERVTSVTIATRAGPQTIACDGIIVSGGFRPEASLLQDGLLHADPATGGPRVDQYGRCSAPTYFAAGNLLRPVETAGWSWREGCRVAAAVAQDLAGALPAADPAQAVTLCAAHPAVRYVMPQVYQPESTAAGGLPELQVRVSRPVRGRLALVVRDGPAEPLWQRRLNALPERRITIPTAALAGVSPGATVEVQLFEEGTAP